MNLKIINKKEEPLLSRTKIEAEIVFENATPSRKDIKSNLAKGLGKDGKLIAVDSIYTQYGIKKAKCLFYVYENEESLKKLEVVKKRDTQDKKKAPESSEEKTPEQAKKQEDKKAKTEAKQEEQKETTKEKGK